MNRRCKIVMGRILSHQQYLVSCFYCMLVETFEFVPLYNNITNPQEYFVL